MLPYCNWMSMASMCVKICWTTALAQVSCKFGFDCLPFRLKCKIYRSSVFSDFFHEVRHHEAQKMMDLGFWKSLDGLRGLKKPPKWLENEGFSVLGKVWYIQTCFFIHYESANGLLTFCKDKIFGKNLILELRSKNLKTYQNARFIKLQYLTNRLRYEVEFLDVNRSLWKQQILVGGFKWVSSSMPEHAQRDSK